jgi:hypothetical protein
MESEVVVFIPQTKPLMKTLSLAVFVKNFLYMQDAALRFLAIASSISIFPCKKEFSLRHTHTTRLHSLTQKLVEGFCQAESTEFDGNGIFSFWKFSAILFP